MARKRRSKEELKELHALVERLREFVRFNYMPAAEVGREIGFMIPPCTRGFWVRPDRRKPDASSPF
jgi:hypothetical protein